MAKDDYDVIVFKILTYLYACMKRKIKFDEATFNHAINRDIIDDGYFVDIIENMLEEELVKDVVVCKPWQNEKFIATELSNMRITASGTRYVREDRTMIRIKKHLVENASTIAGLINVVFGA